jgi:hypothetical protein
MEIKATLKKFCQTRARLTELAKEQKELKKEDKVMLEQISKHMEEKALETLAINTKEYGNFVVKRKEMERLPTMTPQFLEDTVNSYSNDVEKEFDADAFLQYIVTTRANNRIKKWQTSCRAAKRQKTEQTVPKSVAEPMQSTTVNDL